MTNAIQPVIQPTQVSGGASPVVSRAYPFTLNLVSGTPVSIDLRSQQNLNVYKDAQGIFIDNSANTAFTSITTPVGQTITVPPQSQGMFPIYIPSANPVFTLSGAGEVTFVLTNFPTPAAVWSVAVAPVIAGALQVYDTTVAGLIQQGQGSATGGAPATVSELAGGIVQSPTLSVGEQAALSLTTDGALIVGGPTLTPVGAAVFEIVTAGTAVVAFPADSILNGGYIVNPNANSIFVDMVNTAGTVSPGPNGTTSELLTGDKFTLPGPLTTAVTVNGTVAAQSFVAVKF